MDTVLNKIERRFVSEASRPGMPVTMTKALRAETEATATRSKIVGYTALYGVDTVIRTWWDSFIERIEKGAFTRALTEKQDVRALRNHDPDNLLARTASGTLLLREDDTGLWVEIDPVDNVIGNDTVESVRRGDLSGMSFAFMVTRQEWIFAKEDGEKDIRIIKDVDLFDVGPVTYPAYDTTTAELNAASENYRTARSAAGLTVPEPPIWVRAKSGSRDVDPAPEVITDPNPAPTEGVPAPDPAPAPVPLPSEDEKPVESEPLPEPVSNDPSLETDLELCQIARARNDLAIKSLTA